MTPSGSGASAPASLPWSDRTKVADLAAGGAEGEQQSEGVEAESRPDLDHAGEAADRQDHAERGGPGDRPPLHEPHPAEDQGGRQVLDEQRDAHRDAGDGREVAGLDAGHGEQAVPGDQGGAAAQQRAVAHRERQHHQGRAGHPQPDHVERVESGLDQRFGRDSGAAEGDRRGQCQAEPGALAAVAAGAVSRMHRHMMTGVDMTVTPNDTCLTDWTAG
ncbi:hypothetical protein RKD38_006480 [Streptomyces ambofaciens]